MYHEENIYIRAWSVNRERNRERRELKHYFQKDFFFFKPVLWVLTRLANTKAKKTKECNAETRFLFIYKKGASLSFIFLLLMLSFGLNVDWLESSKKKKISFKRSFNQKKRKKERKGE